MHVCLERVRISDPVRYEEIIKRAALRGRVSRKRRDVWKYRKAIGELEVDLVKAKVRRDCNSKLYEIASKCNDETLTFRIRRTRRVCWNCRER